MPKLLLVINNIDFLYSHRWPIVEAALSEGYEVHIACYYDESTRLRRHDEVTYHFINFSRASVNLLKDIAVLIALINLFRELQPSVIHNVSMKPILYGSLAARFFTKTCYVNAISGLGYLFSTQSFKTNLIRKLLLKGLYFGLRSKRCYYIFQNKEDQHEFISHHLVYSNKHVYLIHGSGVDLSTFKPCIVKDDIPKIILPARMLWSKGVGYFVKAAEIICRTHDAHFILVGKVDSDNPEGVSQNQLDQWAQSGVIEYWGWQKDMAAVYAKADIICLPTYYREGIPKSLIEAAGCGLPIVTTDSPGCNFVVRDNENGFLVPMKNLDDLIDRLIQLIESKALRLRMGERSYQLALEYFDINEVVARHLKIYREAIYAK